jgi:hypothetical protein
MVQKHMHDPLGDFDCKLCTKKHAMKTKFPEGSNFEKTKILSKNLLFCLFEPEKQKYIKSGRTKVVRNMKTHF